MPLGFFSWCIVLRRLLRAIILGSLIIGMLLIIAGGVFLFWGYHYITRDLPDLESVKSYNPSAVTSLHAADGTLIAEFFEERRYPVPLAEIPPMVRNAFLAAEDVNFYSHPGIDPVGIFRALIKNLRAGEARQGGSTITQQVVKNLLLTPERSLERKAKEAVLSWLLEKRLSKDEILELYLNMIFFGNTAYGIKAAAHVYFHKELAELTVAEAAMLAGLPKAPSYYSPHAHPERAKKRQRYVLQQMAKAGFISEDEGRGAARSELQVYRGSAQNVYHAPYYVAEVRRNLVEKWPQYMIDRDGLRIDTAVDLVAYEMAERALQRGLRDADKRRGWRGPLAQITGADQKTFEAKYAGSIQEQLAPNLPHPALITAWDARTQRGTIFLGRGRTGKLSLENGAWAKKQLGAQDQVRWQPLEGLLRIGDVIEVIPREQPATKDGENARDLNGEYQLDQTPELEGAVVLLHPESGKVITTIGGFSYQRSVFNRATQALRQPGSTFKPVVYLAAIDGFRYTPATIVHDMPQTFRIGDQIWTPANFDEHFLGPITLQTALEKSRNLVSADIVARIGVDAVIQYARKLGITSSLGRNLSLALGSSEVTPLEMTRAYGVLAARGVLADSIFVTRITDRHGTVLYDFEKERIATAKQVIPESSAFIMAHMMKGVIERGTGYRIRPIGRPVAGKTGTSNDQMDAWFVGYTPTYTCGVWVGFDQKRTIGDKETGGVVSAPIWLALMQPYLQWLDEREYEKAVEQAKLEAEQLGTPYVAPEKISPLDFSIPEGVDPYLIDRNTGAMTIEGDPEAILEYFAHGSEPRRNPQAADQVTSYLESPDF